MSVQRPMKIPQALYDELMALPPGTDITEYFEFEPGWDLTVTTTRVEDPRGAQPDAGDGAG